MDLNDMLCVGRSDRHRCSNDSSNQHFLPHVSSFKMDSLRGSVRKLKPDSKTSSRRSSNSRSPSSKSILREPSGSPPYGSPQGSRSVRFRDGRRSPTDTAYEYSRLHVNETTQTNGNYNGHLDERYVQVYSAQNGENMDRRNDYSSMDDDRFRTPPVSSSTPRSTRDRSPVNHHGYYNMADSNARQRELPKTPGSLNQDSRQQQRSRGYDTSESRGIQASMSPSKSPTRSPSRSPTRPAQGWPSPTRPGQRSPSRSPTRQTPFLSDPSPIFPDGHKIVQNMGVGTYPMQHEFIRDPKGIDTVNGRKIIQNMDLGHLPKEKSIGIQTREDEVEIVREMGIQTMDDIEDDRPKDVSVQTPREVEVQTVDDLSMIASDDDDFGTHVNAFSQTMSDDDESDFRDEGVQTGIDVGVQTPITVSIQTSDQSEDEDEGTSTIGIQTFEEEDEDTTTVGVQTGVDDDEDTATVGVQTTNEPETGKRVVPNLDIHTSVWSNTRHTDSFSLGSSDDESDYSDDDEVRLPAHLTKPFPKRDPLSVYDKLNRNTADNQLFGSYDRSSGKLIDHSARQLLEGNTPSYKYTDISAFKGTGTATSSSPSTRRSDVSKPAGYSRDRPFSPSGSLSKVSQMPEINTDMGTQFDSEYHLKQQRKEDRIKEISESLEFTPIETHSFDPGSKSAKRKHVPRSEPNSARDTLSRNTFIKDFNLGPPPAKTDNWFDKQLREISDISPPRQRIVKSVNFSDTPLERHGERPRSDYIFFKKTAAGSRYDSFEPALQKSIMKPCSYTSPSSTDFKPRQSSAPSRPEYTSNTGHLTPALSHLRKQAIRRRAVESARSSSASRLTSSCQRSDTFISSTKPPPPPLTLPLSDALPTSFPKTPPRDEGEFESLGNQPRYLNRLNDSANNRRDATRNESKTYRVTKRTDTRSTSGKPPIPHGRKQEKEKRIIVPSRSTTSTASNTILSPSSGSSKCRSRSADSTRVSRSTSKSSDRGKSRDQGTSVGKRYRSASRDTAPNRVTVRRTDRQAEDSDAMYLGNDTIQRIIERSNL